MANMQTLESLCKNALVFPILPLTIIGLILVYIPLRIFYNLCLHPLRKYPGPKLFAGTICTISYHRLAGRGPFIIADLHNKYGPVVRVAPDELSYINSQAWKDIYGHRTAGKPTFRKDVAQIGPEESGSPGLLRAEGPDHQRKRRMFNHAFSDRALTSQESLIKTYCDHLVTRLNDLARDQEASPHTASTQVDMVKMYNFTTFDIMGDLTFGEDLGLLNTLKYTAWVDAIFGHVRSISFMHAIARWPALNAGVRYMMPKSAREQREEHAQYCSTKVAQRMSKKIDRPDFWSLLEKNDAIKDFNNQELTAIMSDFMIAGTETTATILSGLTYYLCRNQDKMKLLVDEIRSVPDSSSLNLRALQSMPYLNACIQEGLRMYPPVPVGNMRLVPQEGGAVLGDWLPGNTTVQVSSYAAYHSSLNFKNPEDFVPERWLRNPPAEYTNDNRDVLNPFGFGPRICIGLNLAYHSTRAIFASVLWAFDIELANEADVWTDQEVHELWAKKPLHVLLAPRIS